MDFESQINELVERIQAMQAKNSEVQVRVDCEHLSWEALCNLRARLVATGLEAYTGSRVVYTLTVEPAKEGEQP